MNKRLRSLDEEIACQLQRSADAGELAQARSYGKPLDLGDGYDETPGDLRMPFKILKDAGVVPPEVELMQRLAAARAALARCAADSAEARRLSGRVQELEIAVALARERLGRGR